MSDPGQPAERVRDFYDAVAAEYAAHFADELEGKPLDRALLERFAQQVRGTGTVYDLGCGPGAQTTAFLHARGVDVRGVDLSLAAGAEAARRHPRIPFMVGNMLSLPLPDGDAAGIVAFYAIVHFGPAQLRTAIGEMGRVMRPGALLLLSFHVGQETVHVDEMFGRSASVDFLFPVPGRGARHPPRLRVRAKARRPGGRRVLTGAGLRVPPPGAQRADDHPLLIRRRRERSESEKSRERHPAPPRLFIVRPVLIAAALDQEQSAARRVILRTRRAILPVRASWRRRRILHPNHGACLEAGPVLGTQDPSVAPKHLCPFELRAGAPSG